MKKEDISFYQVARNSKGLTQEKASELLNISVESLRAYEAGRTAVPDDICVAMMDIYDANYLAAKHLRINAAGAKVIPEFKVGMPVPQAILQLQKEVKDVVNYMDRLIEIGSDGVIDASEQKDFEKIIKEIEELKTALYNIEYAK